MRLVPEGGGKDLIFFLISFSEEIGDPESSEFVG